MHGLTVELEHTAGFGSSPWAAAMLGHPSAATVMQVTPDHHGSYHAAAVAAAATAHHHGTPTATALPMDLHVSQGFPYYRLVRSLYSFLEYSFPLLK